MRAPGHAALLLLLCAEVVLVTAERIFRRHLSGTSKSDGYNSKSLKSPNLQIQKVVGQLMTFVDLSCNFNAGDNLKIKWFKVKDMKQKEISKEDSNYLFYYDTRFRILADSFTLRIWYPKFEDEGVYKCTAQTPSGAKVKLFRVFLKAGFSEIIGATNNTKTGIPGQPLRLSCILKDIIEHPNYIFWFKENRLLNYALKDGAAVRMGVKGSELIIPKANINHEGNYTCVPSNARPASVNVILNIDPDERRILLISRNKAKPLRGTTFFSTIALFYTFMYNYYVPYDVTVAI